MPLTQHNYYCVNLYQIAVCLAEMEYKTELITVAILLNEMPLIMFE